VRTLVVHAVRDPVIAVEHGRYLREGLVSLAFHCRAHLPQLAALPQR
jgi:hypothetical protein